MLATLVGLSMLLSVVGGTATLAGVLLARRRRPHHTCRHPAEAAIKEHTRQARRLAAEWPLLAQTLGLRHPHRGRCRGRLGRGDPPAPRRLPRAAERPHLRRGSGDQPAGPAGLPSGADPQVEHYQVAAVIRATAGLRADPAALLAAQAPGLRIVPPTPTPGEVV